MTLIFNIFSLNCATLFTFRTLDHMRKICLLSTLVFSILVGNRVFAQDFSNKGKDFYLCFPAHVPSSNLATLSIWITSDRASSGTVTMGNGAFSAAFSVAANGLAEIQVPHAAAHISNAESNLIIRKSIRIKVNAGQPAVVAYAQQWAGARSAATLVLPVNVLGKKYFSSNFNQPGGGLSQFDIIAIDSNTSVRVTPRVLGVQQAPFVINFLLPGDMYQYQNSQDLTGTLIESIASGTGGCKPIAVFSGSSNLSMGTNTCFSQASSDPLFQQLYPVGTWGKNFGLVDFADYRNGNPYRVMASEDNTSVFFDGVLVATLNAGQIYPTAFTSNPVVIFSPTYISADKPVCVMQYAQSSACTGQTGPSATLVGDPEMVILNPIEQNIKDITIFSSNQQSITRQYINVLIKTIHAPSFKINGAAPVNPWQPFLTLPGYSFLRQQLPGIGSYRLTADSGFNAICYGWGNVESYAYSAGTNVKDPYQHITIKNQHATVDFAATCKSTPFYFSMVFPYEPTQINWEFGPLLNGMGILDVTVNPPAGGYDSTWLVNGKAVYRYRLPIPYSITAAGTYPIKVTATNPTPDGCGGIQEIEWDLEVYAPPVAEFTFNSNGCLTNPITFTDNPQNTSGRTLINWYWDFADGNSATTPNTSHTYGAPGAYNVGHVIITDVGCISDTTRHLVDISNPPTALFNPSTPRCVGTPITFTDGSTVSPGNTLNRWYWDFGDGNTLLATSPVAQTHTYAAPGNYTATLKVETTSGCQSILFSFPIVINVNPVAGFNFPDICLPSGSAQFTNTTTISDGTLPFVTYLWDFGDGNTSTQPNPLHNYGGVGPYNATLTATSNNGCIHNTVRTVNTIYLEPQAVFTRPAEVCFGSAASFVDNSSAVGSTITAWAWNFGDGNTSTLQNPMHTYAAPGTYTVTLSVTSAVGCTTVNNIASQSITVIPSPSVGFTTSNPLCENSNALFTSISVPNAGVFTQYAWTVNGTPQGGNSPTLNYTPPSAGVYTIQLSVLTDKGCTNQTSGPHVVQPKPNAGFDFPNICLPSGAAQFANTSTIINGTPLTYLWDFGDGNTSTLSNPLHVFGGTGPYNVTLTATATTGCANSIVRSVNTIFAEPQAAFTSPPEVCVGSLIGFSENSNAPGSTVTKWNWDFGDGNTSTVRNPTHIYAAPGVYTVTLNVESAIGCRTVSNFASHNVIVNALPAANFIAAAPFCETRNTRLTDNSLPNSGALSVWRWNFGDGNSAVLSSGAPFDHVYALAGNYDVTLQVETDKGCISSIKTQRIAVSINPKAGFIVPEICLTDLAAPFTDTSSVLPGSIVAWDWNFGDPNANAANPNTSTLQNPGHRYTAMGPYTVTLIVTSNTGCKDTISQTMIVNGSIPVAGYTVQNPTILCSNNSVSIKDASTIDFGSLIRIEIYWDYANNPLLKTTDNNPVFGKMYTNSYPEFGTPLTKDYVIRYVVYSGIICVNTFNDTITLHATPTIQFNAVNPVCSSEPAFQLNPVIVNGLPGTGVFSGTGVSPTGMFDPATGGGLHTIRYTFTGTNTCTNFIDKIIEIYPTPGANAGPDKVVLEGGTVMLTPSLAAGMPVTYLWTPPTGLSNPAIATPNASPADDITYTLTVTSDKGCSASDKVFVKVLRSVEIPNIFSPNGDGVHDKWMILYLESYPGCTIDVYNRYGQLVYHSIGYTNPWDGKVNGKDAPVGTYYYIVDPKNGRAKRSGYVDIIR